ncbi:pentapeptide repeat-containing protein [Nocardia sp. CNY236]|uniref:pentapeptide repeat-containing protein n=1 Tax=Nocardia sp. CNY236 TaxID=1169152 RepID=UPI00048CED42|nr:pentapeptide repeat-containing protein [Nocardia sp. CNY236]
MHVDGNASDSGTADRIAAAEAQLRAPATSDRLDAVQALADIGDETDGPSRQRCVEALCRYLRAACDGERRGDSDDRGTTEQRTDYCAHDREVRDTIVGVVAERVRPDAACSWSTSDFDFRGAWLGDADFSGAVFSGDVVFERATFSGDARFDAVMFCTGADFKDATFNGSARFEGASFGCFTRFSDATFGAEAWFERARFTGACFMDAKFSEAAWFGRTMFEQSGRFAHATFGAEADFSEAIFNEEVLFGAATFRGTADFHRARCIEARFDEAIFHADARFDRARFELEAWFDDAEFHGNSTFENIALPFASRFYGTDFGTARIVFDNPRQWGPCGPVFDWGSDGVGKPANVEPQNWPPAAMLPLQDPPWPGRSWPPPTA